jgi:hypothetical protein
MAAKPHMTVRLSPSILHGLQFIAERETMLTAELARTIISAEVRGYLAKHGLQAQCQDAYMTWLAERRASGQADDAGDVELDGEPDPGHLHGAEASPESGASGPYGPLATHSPLFAGQGLPAKPLSQVISEADRLVERFTARGARKGGR